MKTTKGGRISATLLVHAAEGYGLLSPRTDGRFVVSLLQFRSELKDGLVIWTGNPTRHSNAAVRRREVTLWPQRVCDTIFYCPQWQASSSFLLEQLNLLGSLPVSPQGREMERPDLHCTGPPKQLLQVSNYIRDFQHLLCIPKPQWGGVLTHLNCLNIAFK
jgi:hypothetical protein